MANSVQRVALYARVSTSNGHQDPEMQLRELREYAERRGLTHHRGVRRPDDRLKGLPPCPQPSDGRRSASGSSMLSLFGSWTGSADRFATWSTLWRNSRPWADLHQLCGTTWT